MSDKANRTFSKRIVVANCVAAWSVIGLSIWRGRAQKPFAAGRSVMMR